METERKAYHIYYNPGHQYVVMDWHGYSTSAEFRAGTELMLQTLIENRASKVLGNIKNMTIIGMDDQDWVENDFIPRAISHGFKAIALVRPVSYFNAVAIESVSYRVEKKSIQIRIFDNVEDAEAWLIAIDV